MEKSQMQLLLNVPCAINIRILKSGAARPCITLIEWYQRIDEAA
jgi:hypothetical protein